MGMDHFGRLADELVDALEWIEDHPDLRVDGGQVIKALQRAINAACHADRARRLRRETAEAEGARREEPAQPLAA